MRRFATLYGENPLHLLGMGVTFVVAGYAAKRLLGARPEAVAVWFVGAAVLHDVALVPVYTVADRLLHLRRPTAGLSRAPWWNYVRFPAALSLLLLLVWYPEIAQRSPIYRAETGLDPSVYLRRWLVVSGVLFAVSAVAFAGRTMRTHRRGGDAPAALIPGPRDDRG